MSLNCQLLVGLLLNKWIYRQSRCNSIARWFKRRRVLRRAQLTKTSLTTSVLWYCWLGLFTCKNRLPYSLCLVCYVGGDVKPCSILTSDDIELIYYFAANVCCQPLQWPCCTSTCLFWNRSQTVLPSPSPGQCQAIEVINRQPASEITCRLCRVGVGDWA